MNTFASAIYTGSVRHRRFQPKQHEFQYQVFMVYLDTREITQVFSLSPFWSLKHFAPAQFKRSDFHINEHSKTANQELDVDESVRKTVFDEKGITLTGPIRMLVNLRYWGFNMNPISTYYCFDDKGENLVAILTEVHNTPWNERHSYVLTGDDFSRKQHVEFSKEFHVSPFNPIQMTYRWHSSTPSTTLALHLENWQNNVKIMDATMTLQKEEISTAALNKILIRFPWMTVKVISAIYWEALKLWWKGVPIFNHPRFNHPRPHQSNSRLATPPIKTSNPVQKETNL